MAESKSLPVVSVSVILGGPHLLMPWNTRMETKTTLAGFALKSDLGTHVWTNAHGVAWAKSIQLSKSGESQLHEAKVLYVSHEFDLAILECTSSSFWANFRVLELADELPDLGARVRAIGFPTTHTSPTMTEGTVSQLEVIRYAHMHTLALAMKISAAINGGNSGGPVVNDEFKVVGVVFQSMPQLQNVGFAIPLPVIQLVVRGIKTHGSVCGICSLGADVQPLQNAALRDAHGVPPKGLFGVRVNDVKPLSSAAKAGMLAGDVLVSIGPYDVCLDGYLVGVASPELEDDKTNKDLALGYGKLHLSYALSRLLPGEATMAVVLRGGERKELVVEATVFKLFMPSSLYDCPIRYAMVGGFVLQPLSQPLVSAMYKHYHMHGCNVHTEAVNVTKSRETSDHEAVVVTGTLHCELTANIDISPLTQVATVQGWPVRNLEHIQRALDEACAADALLTLKMVSHEVIVLNARAAKEASARVLARTRNGLLGVGTATPSPL